MFAYGGKILRVNLSDRKVTTKDLDEGLIRNYIGGRGFASRILYDELKPGIDPLGAENKIVFASGPLAGLFVPASGKTTLASKSPATNSYGDSNVGGHLAPEIKYAGYDVIIIEGKANKPSYIYILSILPGILIITKIYLSGMGRFYLPDQAGIVIQHHTKTLIPDSSI